MANRLRSLRNGAVGFIDWLDGLRGIILTVFLKIPFVVRDFDVHDVRWIKGNLCVAANFTNELAMNDRDITNDATIAQGHVHDLVCHAGLGLFQENLAPVFWQTRLHHLTRKR